MLKKTSITSVGLEALNDKDQWSFDKDQWSFHKDQWSFDKLSMNMLWLIKEDQITSKSHHTAIDYSLLLTKLNKINQ